MHCPAHRLALRAAACGLSFALSLAPPASGQLAPITLPESLDTANSGALLPPALAANERREVYSVWHRQASNGTLQLMGRGFHSFGTEASIPTLIDTNVSPRGYDVAAVSSNIFLVVWIGPQGTAQPSIFGARYTLGGAKQGETFVISPPTGLGLPSRPSVACRPGRGCFVAWSLDPPSGISNPSAVVGQRLDENLQLLGGAFVINQTPLEAPTAPRVAMSPGGRTVVAWPQQKVVIEGEIPIFTRSDVGTPTLRIYGADGQALGNEISLEEAHPRIDTDGMDVAWNGQNQLLAIWDRKGNLPEPGIYRQLLSEVGAALGERKKINRETSLFKGQPALDRLEGFNAFVATWDALRDVGSDVRRELTVQLLSAEGEIVGNELPAVQASRASELTPASVAAASPYNTVVGFGDQVNPRTGRARVVRFSASAETCFSPIPLPFPIGPCTFVGVGREQLLVMALYRGEDGRTTPADPLSLTRDTAAFFYQSSTNPEVFAKVVDGRGLNERLWFFYAALSNQEYLISVFDGAGNTRAYYNPPGALASVGDTNALAEPTPFPGVAANGTAAGLFTGGGCAAGGASLCLLDDRFRVEVSWRDFEGNEGIGTAEQLTNESGHFWFFAAENIELAVKILDGRPINGHFWLFYASLSNVEFTVRVFDEAGQLLKTYTNPPGTFASVADTGSL